MTNLNWNLKMRIQFNLLFTSLMMFTIYAKGYIYNKWSPDGVKTLWCPKSSRCEKKATEIKINHCCACYAVPEWELPNGSRILSLDIEIMDIRGKKNRIVSRLSTHNSSDLFHLTYKNGNLQLLPVNACIFKIVSIDVTNNLLTDIGNVSCFTELDILIMRYNKITYVSNQTFIGMSKLRTVDLSYNLISHLDLGVFGDVTINILYFNFDGNPLKEVDTSNMFFPNKTMCGGSYANIKHAVVFTNIKNYILDTDNGVICTDMNWSNTSITQHPLLVACINLEVNTVYKYLPCGQWLFHGSAYNCDCNLAELFKMDITHFYRFYSKKIGESYCQSPNSLANMTINDLIFNQTMRDKMICDVVDGCPKNGNCKCECTSQPNRETFIVDCSNQSCTDFPEIVPKTNHPIILNMSKNQIAAVNFNRSYFDKVAILDLSGNNVTEFDGSINKLATAKQIIGVNHRLQDLPRSIQLMDPNIFHFGLNGIPCTCDNRWIGEWRQYKKASKLNPLLCSNYINTSFEDFLYRFTNCETETSYYWTISIVCTPPLLLIILSVLLKFFRFDFLILKRRLLLKEKQCSTWKIDVYVSFDEDNDEVRYFVLSMLEPFFKEYKITTYVPCRDGLPGYTEEYNVISSLIKCKYFVLIQSHGMYDFQNLHYKTRRMEYTLAWNYFIDKKLDKIFVANFDNEKPEMFQASKTKALYRLGLGFEMFNRQFSFYEKLLQTLIFDSKHNFKKDK